MTSTTLIASGYLSSRVYDVLRHGLAVHVAGAIWYNINYLRRKAHHVSTGFQQV